MGEDQAVGVNECLDWISGLKRDARQIVFAVLDQDRAPLGIARGSELDRLHGKASWAFHLAAGGRGDLESVVGFALISFVFDTVGLEKLNCEVVEGNDAIVALHRKFLFQEEGFRRSNIMQQGARAGVRMLGLTKDEWAAGKAQLREMHGRLLA